LGWKQLVKTSLEQCQRSIGVECSDRIEAHGAHRRDVTRGDGDSGEHGRDAGEGGVVVGRDTVKQAGHEMRNNKRAHQAYTGSGGSQSEALAQNHPEDIAPLRAQRKANGDLARLLIDPQFAALILVFYHQIIYFYHAGKSRHLTHKEQSGF